MAGAPDVAEDVVEVLMLQRVGLQLLKLQKTLLKVLMLQKAGLELLVLQMELRGWSS